MGEVGEEGERWDERDERKKDKFINDEYLCNVPNLCSTCLIRRKLEIPLIKCNNRWGEKFS